jgi:hypothetical protein
MTHAETDSRRITRRNFLAGAAMASGAVAVPGIIPSHVWAAQGNAAPSGRINVGLIGHGCMGNGHLHRLAGDPTIQVQGVCDVDRTRREEGKRRVEEICAARSNAASYQGCTAYNDYREMLARPDIDAVVIATPDHWHAMLSIHAMEAGKDVYCEKPVSVTVYEGRRLVEVARRYGRIFQTGTQYRSISTIRAVCNFVRGGGLGKVKSVFTLWGKVGAHLGVDSYIPEDFALPAEAVPDGLDWDLWVGPAPWQPYNSAYHRNPIPGVVPWAFHESFGAGAITWYHSHAADVIQYALGMENSGPVEIIPPGQGQFPTLTCRYANGTLLHLVDNWGMVKDVYKAVPATARLAGNFGGIFVGEQGWVTSMSTGGPIEGGPDEMFDRMKLATREVNIGDNDHHENWFDCVRTRRQPSCSEEIGHRGASLGHLSIIGYKLARPLTWDPEKEVFPSDSEANRLLGRATRSPWRM